MLLLGLFTVWQKLYNVYHIRPPSSRLLSLCDAVTTLLLHFVSSLMRLTIRSDHIKRSTDGNYIEGLIELLGTFSDREAASEATILKAWLHRWKAFHKAHKTGQFEIPVNKGFNTRASPPGWAGNTFGWSIFIILTIFRPLWWQWMFVLQFWT